MADLIGLKNCKGYLRKRRRFTSFADLTQQLNQEKLSMANKHDRNYRQHIA